MSAPSMFQLPSDFEKYRDFFLWEHEDTDKVVESAFAFRAKPEKEDITDTAVQNYLGGLYAHIKKKFPGTDDFAVAYQGVTFRGHRISTLTGPLLALRRVPTKAPVLEDLALPPLWRDILMFPDLAYGGLIFLAAVMGQGKSTTTAAIITSRLQRYAGYCLTIEDPCELPLHGMHGQGICIQTAVKPEHGRQGFAEGLRGALRSYPTLPSGSMCLVGEVRDGETAAEALRAGVNGTLVITTVHAKSVHSAIARFLAMAETVMGPKTARDLLASSFRVGIHQTLTLDPEEEGWRRGKIGGEMLFSKDETSQVAAAIRAEGAESLVEPIRYQSTLHAQNLRFSEFIKRVM